ncbi:MAG: nucleoside-diphosphate sugar epimerase/dehydratase, partial [Agathobacter sp.]|nr:nucleoside-diphosphate sugar epimerase/dehydratase [Agathobacter sp.]
SIWRFASISEFLRIIISYLVLIPVACLFQWKLEIKMPYAFWIIGLMISFALTTASRFAYRLIRTGQKMFEQKSNSYAEERVMVIGAGNAGQLLIRELIMSSHLSAKACCIIDDNPAKKGRFLDGIPIVGNRHDIPEMVVKYNINKIIYAVPTTAGKDRKEILNICKDTGCQVQVIPGIYQMVDGKVSVSNLRPVSIEDLLGRDEVVVDNDQIHSFLEGKVIMVTGGGGSIGSELCRQIARENPKKLLIFDIYENNAYEIQQELRRKYPNVHFETLIGSVRNTNRLESIFKEYKPDVIYHAAAHKHVPLMEESPNEAIKNNVFGTYKLSKAAAEFGVKKFVLISTDKAVNPTNIMGASKRLCEMIIQMMNRNTDTDFVAVRFGNVLGSNGSVIPLFKKQIEEGGPVTVTDPRIIRYFMTIPEAVALVLQAGLYAKGGEIFVLDMGDPVKIVDMARNLIRLSGYEPDVDIKIKYTGLRPGEKLYEEMLMSEEGLKETPNKLIHIGQPIEMDDELFAKQLSELEKACKAERSDIKQIVADIVKTYHPEL